MPSEAVGLVVSTGIGFSVVAGLLSGVFYMLAQGLKSKRNKNKAILKWHCAVCGVYLRSIEGVLEGDRIVTCTTCEGHVCKGKCCKRDENQGGWICKNCRAPWYQEILKVFDQSNHDLFRLRSAMDPEQLNRIDQDIETLRRKEKEQIRDFIERLVETMLGGSVDDASVTKLYNDNHYDALFERYHQDLSNALTDLGSALHISIASKSKLIGVNTHCFTFNAPHITCINNAQMVARNFFQIPIRTVSTARLAPALAQKK